MPGAQVQIVGQTVILRPYLRHFVVKYHSWMEDPVLRELTASEPLTLEEEYAMQASWIRDEQKCTFILFDRSLPDGLDSMCGDVNLYLNDPEDGHSAEMEIMIAEAGSRRKGIAKEALLIMMVHGHDRLGIRQFVAKIGFSNTPSQYLFVQLGFQETRRSEMFQEITYVYKTENAAGQLGSVKTTMRYQALAMDDLQNTCPADHTR